MSKITDKQRNKVAELYNGKLSGQAIAHKLNLSLNQVYDALIKENIARRSSAEQNQIRFEKTPLSYNFKENLTTNDRELLISAVMLYQGEGAKTGVTVDLANSDVRILKVFMQFLRKICRVDEKRVRLYLYCFSDQDPTELIKYWSDQLRLNSDSFTKPYVREVKNLMSRRMPYGVLHIRYSDKRLLEKILSLSFEVLEQYS